MTEDTTKTEDATAKTEDSTTKDTAADETTLKNIQERLEFFFSHANIRQDKFLQKQLLESDEFGGSIDAPTLLKFKSIQQYTESPSVLLQAAQGLPDLLVVEGESVKCKTPLKKTQLNDNIPLSLYVSNIPIEASKYVVKVTDVQDLFAKYGKVALVKFKWKPKKPAADENGDDKKEDNGKKRRPMVPSEACIVEFATEDELKAAAADLIAPEKKDEDTEEPQPKTTLQLKDKTLQVQTLQKWIDERKQDKLAKKKRKKDDNEEEEAKEEVVEVKEFTLDWKPGCVVQLKGLNTDSCDREAIRAVVEGILGKPEDSKAIYIDYSRGQADGAIRFLEPSDDVKKLAEALPDKEICEKKLDSVEILTGEAEETYWKTFIEFKNKQLRHNAEERRQRKKRKTHH